MMVRDPSASGQLAPIFTFYSYKGGVGRSMALANIGEWLYRHGLRVVMIDWDLEAPGLETFFYRSDEELEFVRSQLGLIDTLTAYQRQFAHLPFPISSDESDESGPRGMPAQADIEEVLAVLREHLPPLRHLLHPVHAPDPAADGRGPALWLLTAGWRAAERFPVYALDVQRFDWAEFYRSYRGEIYFEWMRRQLGAEDLADVILIDSRTGVTEMGGVCTRQMADVVVSFCVPNDQNLVGLVRMVRSFRREEVMKARRGRPLETIVVPTRLDKSEIADRNRFEREFRASLETGEFMPKAFRKVDLAFWDLGIPYVPKYAYKEKLAIGDPDSEERAKELEDAYNNLATALALLSREGSALQRHVSTEVKRKFGQLLPRVFILSARAADREAIRALRRHLEAEGISVRPDVGGRGSEGDAWQKARSILDQSEFMVIPLAPGLVQDEQVRRAWRYARLRGICICPVALDRIDPSSQEAVPSWLRRTRIYDMDADWDELVSQLRGTCGVLRVPNMVPELPPYYVERPRELERGQDALLESKQKGVTAALWGGAGSGKTVLAAALCRNERIEEAYDDGNLWATLGPQSDLKGELARLCAAFTGEAPRFTAVDDASRYLANLLEDRRCLIVLDDVWDPAHLRPFLYGGSACACLITTRNFDVAVQAGQQIEVGSMADAEAEALLIATSGETRLGGEYELELARRLGKWPLAVALAGSALRQRRERGDTVEGAVAYLEQALDQEGVVAFDRRGATSRDQSVALSVEVSLDHLTEEEQAKLLALAASTQEPSIGLKETATLWSADEHTAEVLLQRFHDLSLLKFDLKERRVHFHPVVLDYLRRRAPAAAIPETDRNGEEQLRREFENLQRQQVEQVEVFRRMTIEQAAVTEAWQRRVRYWALGAIALLIAAIVIGILLYRILVSPPSQPTPTPATVTPASTSAAVLPPPGLLLEASYDAAGNPNGWPVVDLGPGSATRQSAIADGAYRLEVAPQDSLTLAAASLALLKPHGAVSHTSGRCGYGHP